MSIFGMMSLAPDLFHNRCHTYILSSYQSMSCSIIETTTTVNMMYKSVFYPGVVHEINCLWKRLSNQNQIDFNMNWILKMSFSSSGSYRQPYVCLKVCRAMDQSVNEIVEYVSSLEASDTPHIQGLKAAMEEVHSLGQDVGEEMFSILFSHAVTCQWSSLSWKLGERLLGWSWMRNSTRFWRRRCRWLRSLNMTQIIEKCKRCFQHGKMWSNERLFQTTR